MSSLHEFGEDDLVLKFRDWLRPADGSPEALGDDCAVLPSGNDAVDQLLTSDSVVEGIHFIPGTAFDRIGRKAVNRALSDIAAMGGAPTYCLLNLGMPSNSPVKNVEALMTAARDAAGAFGASIVGGDVTHMDRVEVHVFCQGHIPSGQSLLRSGAQSGDKVFVTGSLGGSLAGHHLDFIPRVKEALWLREHVCPSAMMDVSDGLAADLPRLVAESGVGAEIAAETIPLSTHLAGDALSAALGDGEDYELLFTVPAGAGEAWEADFRNRFSVELSCIGGILDRDQGLTLRNKAGMREAWPEGGYQHF